MMLSIKDLSDIIFVEPTWSLGFTMQVMGRIKRRHRVVKVGKWWTAETHANDYPLPRRLRFKSKRQALVHFNRKKKPRIIKINTKAHFLSVFGVLRQKQIRAEAADVQILLFKRNDNDTIS